MSDRNINITFISVLFNAILLKLILPLQKSSLLTYIAVYLISYLLPILLTRFSTKKASADECVSLPLIERMSIGSCAEIFIALALISTVLGHLFPGDIVQQELSLSNIVVAGITAPILEEIFWRGTVFKILSRYGTSQAMIISSLFFGLLHNGRAGLIYAFIAGMLFSYLYVRTGSLLPCTLLHLVNNTVSLISGRYPWFILAAIGCALLIILVKRLTRVRSASNYKGLTLVPLSYTVIESPILYLTFVTLIIIRAIVS